MDTAKDTTMQHVTDAVIEELKRAANDPRGLPVYVRAYTLQGILARIERLESDLATAEQDSRQKQARIERLEQAEKERDALRAKIEAMERQKPVGKFAQHPSNGLWEQDGYGDNPDANPLYAQAGAKGE